MNRRNFLHSLAVASAFAAVGSTRGVLAQKPDRRGLFPVPAEAYSNSLFSMSPKQLEPLVGRVFTVTAADGSVSGLTLKEVNASEGKTNAIRGSYGESFSLIFEGEDKLQLDQDVFDFAVDGMAPFSALVVPTGRRRKQYEVVVNHVTR
jgi:hypothetical protein